MNYQSFSPETFFHDIFSENDAIDLLWKCKFSGQDFVCRECKSTEYYQLRSRGEIRQCRKCKKQFRVRANTIFERSKVSLLKWFKAIYYMMFSKRGISTFELKDHLQMTSYGTVWTMQQKIRDALRQRDDLYSYGKAIEVELKEVGKKLNKSEKDSVFVEFEKKSWISKEGKQKPNLGFARVLPPQEKINEKDYKSPKKTVLTSKGVLHFQRLYGQQVEISNLGTNQKLLETTQPWAKKMLANCELWILSTFHGVSSKYLNLYVSEYFYRFNRRHDFKRLFHRALHACATSTSKYFIPSLAAER